jgi:hypothetical protein
MPDQQVERGVQSWRVRRLDERRMREHAQSDDGLSPCRGIVRAAPRGLPEDRARGVGQGTRERTVQANEPVGDEPLDVGGLEPARR